MTKRQTGTACLCRMAKFEGLSIVCSARVPPHEEARDEESRGGKTDEGPGSFNWDAAEATEVEVGEPTNDAITGGKCFKIPDLAQLTGVSVQHTV